jgi:hypothetical protein
MNRTQYAEYRNACRGGPMQFSEDLKTNCRAELQALRDLAWQCDPLEHRADLRTFNRWDAKSAIKHTRIGAPRHG